MSTFIKAEENNFALFRFVNDLSNEIEQLEAQIQDLKDEVKRYQGKSTPVEKQKELKELEEKLEKTELTAERFELDYE